MTFTLTVNKRVENVSADLLDLLGFIILWYRMLHVEPAGILSSVVQQMRKYHDNYEHILKTDRRIQFGTLRSDLS